MIRQCPIPTHIGIAAVLMFLGGMVSAAESDTALQQLVQPDEAAGERDWQFVVIHHSGTTSGSVESIHRAHRRRRDRNGNPWLGIGYHFVIGNGSGMRDGQISSTFRWKQQIHGAHAGSLRHNDLGIGICVIGNFEEAGPGSAQTESVTRLVRVLTTRYGIPPERIIRHSQVRATACPGRHFPFRDVVANGTRQAADDPSVPTARVAVGQPTFLQPGCPCR